ncbi:MAG TPA: antitoxin family protein [Verrucomicrobiales bacterium]|jgi:predicted DNA-binding antitoxin AbrB/MazE fold protein|nr:antitoxin family protein [Verrucomicrobiales bacterium]
MTATLEAIYEAGHLRLLQELPLPERTRVLVRVETPKEDPGREAWLAAGEQSLMKVWDNDADNVYNELLAP